MTVENFLLETGDDLLLENGEGIFLESYVPPNRMMTVGVAVGPIAVTEVMRINTPKFLTSSSVATAPIVSLSHIYSSAPAKFLVSSVNVAPAAVAISNISSITPSFRRPVRHLVWVSNFKGTTVSAID